MWRELQITHTSGDSDEGNQYSGLIVISIPGSCDQSSERSDAGFCILVESDHDRQVRVCCCWSCGKVEIAPAISKGVFCPSFPQLLARRFIHFSSFSPFFLRMESPRISMRCALCTSRSRIPSASVGSPICSCQRATGNYQVRIIERVW